MRTIINPVVNKIWRHSLIIGFLALLLPTFLFIGIDNRAILDKFSNLVLLCYLTIANAAFVWAAKHTRQLNPKLAISWILLSISMMWLVLGQTFWFFAHVLLGQNSYDFVVANIRLLFYPTFWLGLYLFPKEKQTRRQRFLQFLDSMTLLVGGLLLMWILWIAPSIRGKELSIEALMLGFISPVCSSTIIFTLAFLIVSPRLEQPRAPLVLLIIGCPLMLAADFDFALQVDASQIELGSITDYLWSLSCIVATLAAVLQATAIAEPSPKCCTNKFYWKTAETIRIILSPTVLVVVYGVLIYYHTWLTPVDYTISSLGMWALFGLVSVRQLLVMTENIDLSSALKEELKERQQAQAALQQVNQVLEQRVLERTQKLVQVNEQLRQNEFKLRYDAFHDKLTGLANRAFFTDFLQQLVHMAQRRSDYQFGILFLDFDSFKVINDSLGHLLGDEFLIALSRRLDHLIGPHDLVARLGGDEFVVLLTRVGSIEDVQMVATHIQDAMHQPFDVDGYRLFTSVSIGIVLGDSSYNSAKDVLRDADIAMYKAKDQGKSRAVVFDASMRVMAMERLFLETELREALIRKEFFLEYQPIWDLREQRVSGFEALVRWFHPQRGIISPLQFIPIAEETGMIIELGQWVLEQACQQMKAWQDKFSSEPRLTISVNISPTQLRQNNLPALVKQTLEKFDFPAACLKLEITESAFLYDIDAALEAFAQLQALGLQLQLDDFGTGYSSLGYLHRLPITTLKIDRTFISRINGDGHHIEIARAISTLAHNLRMSIIAEGVETESQLTHLEELECEQVQGYLISKPLGTEDVEKLILEKISLPLPSKNLIPFDAIMAEHRFEIAALP